MPKIEFGRSLAYINLTKHQAALHTSTGPQFTIHPDDLAAHVEDALGGQEVGIPGVQGLVTMTSAHSKLRFAFERGGNTTMDATDVTRLRQALGTA